MRRWNWRGLRWSDIFEEAGMKNGENLSGVYASLPAEAGTVGDLQGKEK